MKRLKGVILKGYILGLRLYYIDCIQLVNIFTLKTLKQIIKGSYKLYKHQKQLQLFITKDILNKIIRDPLVIKEDANLQVYYLLTFTAFLHLSKVTYLVEDKLRSNQFFKTKVTCLYIKISFTVNYLVLHLKRSKTDVKNKGVLILVAAINSLNCLVKAITYLLAVDP